jgi:DNA polymerase-3 subunit epsilon
MGALEGLWELVKRNNFVILDTETTGLDWQSQICQIAIIDYAGHSLVDTLVKPTIPIPADATDIHGITDEMVVAAPTFDQVWPSVLAAVKDRDLVVYNLSYDINRLVSSLQPYGLSPLGVLMTPGCHMVCAMITYAEHWGEWDRQHRSYRWQSLSVACQQQSITIQEVHRALGDCQLTLALVRKVCAEVDWLSANASS